MTDLLLTLVACWAVHWRVLQYLRYLQQEGYDTRRFLRWVWSHKGSILWLWGDPRQSGKLRLHMTPRATAIYRTACALCWVALLALHVWWGLLVVGMVPLALVAAVGLLEPYERRVQARFAGEARQRLARVSPYVVGITGSYGKSSAKAALAQLLQVTRGSTFWPPQGVNTPMGITRAIREGLQLGHQYAVMEMGAYGRGSIARLCDLTPPHAALITSIGTAHLERFGSEETIWHAKSELAQAVPTDGVLVCYGDDRARDIAATYPKATTLLYGYSEGVDCRIVEWQIGHGGMEFVLEWQGREWRGATPLFGRPALANAVGAYVMACALGSDPHYALSVLRTLDPVANRLQVERGPVTYVHDAYNSNPVGFEAALEVLGALPARRRIVVTPGMVELGPQQHGENARLGKMAAGVCDLAIVVGGTNREALVEGLQAGGMQGERVVVCTTREEAFQRLAAVRREGDAVLLENDLPDGYC